MCCCTSGIMTTRAMFLRDPTLTLIYYAHTSLHARSTTREHATLFSKSVCLLRPQRIMQISMCKETKIRSNRKVNCVTKLIIFASIERQILHSFIHSIGKCRMRQSLAVLRSFFHSSLLCTFPCHPSPPSFFHPLSPHLAIYFLVYLSIYFISLLMCSTWFGH